MKDNYPERPDCFVSVTWYGQAGFRLAAGDSRVLIDPFLTDRPDRRDQPVVYEFAPDGGPARFLGYLAEIGGIRFFHSGDSLVYPELPVTLSALAPDVLMIPINGRDHMREASGIVGNMNETEAAWLCAEVGPAYVIPMHYEALARNTGDPGQFTTLVAESGGTTAVIVPTRARPITVTLT